MFRYKLNTCLASWKRAVRLCPRRTRTIPKLLFLLPFAVCHSIRKLLCSQRRYWKETVSTSSGSLAWRRMGGAGETVKASKQLRTPPHTHTLVGLTSYSLRTSVLVWYPVDTCSLGYCSWSQWKMGRERYLGRKSKRRTEATTSSLSSHCHPAPHGSMPWAAIIPYHTHAYTQTLSDTISGQLCTLPRWSHILFPLILLLVSLIDASL